MPSVDWRSSWRLLLVVLVTFGAMAVGAVPAQATCEEDAGIIGGGGEAGAECDEPDEGGGPAPDCDPDSVDIAWYGDWPSDLSDEESTRILILLLRLGEPPEGKIYFAAYNCAGRYLGGPYLVDDPDWPIIQGLRAEARARVTPPLPDPNVSPSEAVVKVPTWLWIDASQWQPRDETSTDGAITVRVEARPVRVVWNLVEDDRSCSGPGIPWSEEAQEDYEAQPEEERGTGNPACTFEFQHSSTTQPDDVYHATVTVSWEFSWWLNGTPRGVFGAIDQSTAFDLRVGEIQALITDY